LMMLNWHRKDWKILVDSRNIARSIIDKIIPDDKLDSDRVRNIFIANNKTDEHKEDIVIELNDGKQYSFFWIKIYQIKSIILLQKT
jgi:hypothetical protein